MEMKRLVFDSIKILIAIKVQWNEQNEKVRTHEKLMLSKLSNLLCCFYTLTRTRVTKQINSNKES